MPNYFTFIAPSAGLDISSYNVGQDPPYVESFQTSARKDYTDYMATDAGVGYVIIPNSTSPTVFTSFTGGDNSTSWPDLAKRAPGTGTTQSGIVVSPGPPYNKRGISGPYNSLGNPYQYCAVGIPTVETGYIAAETPGWIVLEVQQAPFGFYQDYYPIEGTDGFLPVDNGPTYTPGELPNTGGSTLNQGQIVFFFDGYQAGDVDTWTVWDGTTNPTTYEDWDTYHSGFVEYNPAFNNNPAGSNHVLQGDITWRNSVSSYVSSTTIQQQFFASADGGQWYPPAIAQWYPNANGGVGGVACRRIC